MCAAYYNENDRQKAAWLRELIVRGLIAPGDVDERSIVDVRPDDLRGFTQCHFFAGVGIWSYALRLAGWPDDRPVWTGSCPCQPFSDAGQKEAFNDQRHLWPEFFRLIEARRPLVCFGEQVASADGLAWLDLVQSDLGDADYTCGCVDLCAAGFGAPHRRQRLFWMAYAECGTAERHGLPLGGTAGGGESEAYQRERVWIDAGDGELAGVLAYAEGAGSGTGLRSSGEAGSRGLQSGDASGSRVLGITESPRSQVRVGGGMQSGTDGGTCARSEQAGSACCPGPLNGFWRDADWIFCRDRKWRPARPGSSPLAHGAPSRVVRLRGYGDGIVAPVAAAFIEAAMKEL